MLHFFNFLKIAGSCLAPTAYAVLQDWSHISLVGFFQYVVVGTPS